MDAIKQIKELGLEKVSEKTFININDLEALLDQDFERFHKTKALGFIQILEREYGLGLGDLREACLKYYESHKEEEPQLFNEYVKPEPPEWKKRLPLIILAILLFALLLYLLFFKTGKNTETFTEPAQNTTILKEASENLIKHKERNDTVPVPVAIETNGSETNESAVSSANATQIPENDIDLDKAVATLFKEQNLSSEKNASETNTTSETKETNSSETLSSSSSGISDTPKVEPAPKEVLSATTKTSSQNTTYPSKLYIEPINRAWIGILYLDNYKKRSYLIRKPLRLNAKRDMLIISGHPRIKVYYRGKRIPIRSKRKVRLLYKDGKIREIDNKTYYSYSRGITW